MATRTSRLSEMDAIGEVAAIQLIRDRNDEGLRWLIENHSARIQAVLLRQYGCSPDLVVDAIYLAALVVWDKIEKFDESKGRLPAYFLLVAKCQLLDLLRNEP